MAAAKNKAFTLLEMLIVSMLIAMVVTAIAQFWQNYSLSLFDLASRDTLTRETRLGIEFFADDFGSALGAVPVESDRLLICKDSGQYPNGIADWSLPDELIEYYLQDGQVIRYNQTDATQIVAAGNVSLFEVQSTDDYDLQINLQLASGDITKAYTFYWNQP